jgi:probable HAF family extracellular repeat protein
MKSAKLMCITAVALLVTLAIPVSLAAQEHPAKHNKYSLVDLGTFGGPNVLFNFSSPTDHLLGSNGTVTGGADTSIVDPYCFNNPDCFVDHGFKWQEGVLTDLGTLGGSNSQGFWINDKGQIAGFAQNGMIDPLLGIQLVHAVLWSDEGTITDLGTFGGYESLSQAVNRRGQVVGLAANTTPDPNAIFLLGQQARAFLWDKKTGMQDLGSLGTGNDAFAQYVNDRGQVAGYAYTNTTSNPLSNLCAQLPVAGVPTVDPFFWENGTMTDVGTLGGVCGFATGLNNRGQVVGVSDLPGDIFYHPFRWDKKLGLKDLGTLGGNYGAANGINDAGDAAGWANEAGDVIFHAVLWPSGKTTPTDLGVTAGFATSVAAAINSKGQIIGCLTSDPSGNCFPYDSDSFLWENGDMVDVNTLVPPHPGVLLSGSEGYINDKGQILLLGLLDNGDNHAFLLTPCEDNHRDGGECEDNAEGATVTAQSRSALVTQNSTTMTEYNPSASARIGALHGRLGRGYQRVVPQSAIANEAESEQLACTSGGSRATYSYVEDEMVGEPSGYCLLNFGHLNGYCVGGRNNSCIQKNNPRQCPVGKKPKRIGGFACSRCEVEVDKLRPCVP